MSYTNGLDDPSAYFQATLYTGNGGTNAITNTGNSDLQPDWIWFKRRDGADNHILFDVIRGVTKGIYADLDNAEDNLADSLASFNSDGFTLGADTGSGGSINGSSETNVAWQWKAGGGQGSSNTDGSINTTYTSVNTTAGFSISKYTGNATNGATVGHGLGAVPEMLIGKDLSDNSAWCVWHKDLTNAGYRLTLSSNAAQSDDTALFGGSSRTAPTSSVFTLGSGGGLNGANANIIYAFSSVKGYSKIGSYTGNGNADGTFIYTGFKPAWLLIKSTATNDWILHDTKRSPHNVSNVTLFPNDNGADVTNTIYNQDILSNGFKARTTHARLNGSGVTYIYMVFAENPFVTSTGVPATAR